MWAIRRSSSSFKKQGFISRSSRIRCMMNKVTGRYSEGNSEGISNEISDQYLSFRGFCKTAHGSSKLFLGWKFFFFSLVGTKSSSEIDSNLDDEFSELMGPTVTKGMLEKNVEVELCKDDVDGEDVEMPHDKLELSDSESDARQGESLREKVPMELLKAITAAPVLSLDRVMDEWIEKGNDLTRTEITFIRIYLRRRHMYKRALQLFEWLELKRQLIFTDKDYASHVDLIAKVHGIHKAETYVERVPKSFRSEVVYLSLLANCAYKGYMKKSEEIFNKMRNLGFPLTSSVCSHLLLLYKKDKKKIVDVLLLMKKENVKPTDIIYQILIDTKGQSNDIAGMEQIIETMKAEGMEPKMYTKSIIAKHYIFGGLVGKAENVLKQMEGEIEENHMVCRHLIALYANLKKVDDVRRIWQLCEPNARIIDCMTAIEAFGKLHKIEEAEAVFDKMSKEGKHLTSKHYYPLLCIYASHKMLAKGKDLVKRMSESGCPIGPLTWDGLIRLYIKAGEVEKADTILQEAAQHTYLKPKFTSYVAVMEEHAKRGEVHDTEKIFYKMRQAGYVCRIHQFQCLIQAYINAKAPCYGIADRMKADNVFPNRVLENMLLQSDPFKKTLLTC
ncbi:hypothetical protein KY290_006318 [Solanum tuberosum]|uniref:Pentatricopeptide repeat-containing protein n=1 Tax=Solanum tuberosum TaxID=4113 RepID=A0ABQ7WGN1_SOLTU|nr:hypothetical protein KY284_006064 [Solanum tuberosum]KAH0753378.1 hypothetical protein KY285_006526 [Solanum tuberosum]KAH0779891.1 hypothetical protein KY290_006318 [Solanum tuberosum]